MDCSFSLSLSLSPPKMVIILPVPVGVTVTVYWSLGLLMMGTSSLQVLHLAMASWDSFGLTTSMSLVILLDDIFFCKHTIFCIAKLQNVLNDLLSQFNSSYQSFLSSDLRHCKRRSTSYTNMCSSWSDYLKNFKNNKCISQIK